MDKQLVISIKTIIVALLILLGVYIVYKLGSIIGILVLSGLIVICMEGAVKYFMKFVFFNKPISRGFAVMISYSLLMLVMLGVLTFIVPPVINEFQKMVVNLSSILKNLSLPPELELKIADMLPQASKVSQGVLAATISVFSNVATFISILIISIYMSLDWENIKTNFVSIFPRDLEDTVYDTLDEIEKSVGSWVRGELLLMFSVGFASFVVLVILGIKYSIAISLVAAIFEAVQMIGPTLTAILAGIIAFAQSPVKGVGVVIAFILIQQLENNYLVPKIMSRVSGFRPLIILLALLVGINFFGVLGAICAVPVLMVTTIVLKRALRYSK